MRHVKILLLAFFTVALFGAGCSTGATTTQKPPQKPPPAPLSQPAQTKSGFIGSCDLRKSLGFCYEYTGSEWNTKLAKNDCDSSPGGVFLAANHCPLQSRVASCLFKPQKKQQPNGTIKYIFYKPMTFKQANMSCPSGKAIPTK